MNEVENMIDVRTVNLPTYFEEAEPLQDDSRFQKVKIFIAHTGENLNHSIFSHDVLESMIPSLANIPILGYVSTNEDDEKDFRGHEKRLSVDDGKFKVSFETHAYGFVPEDNEAHFEITGGKEWLVTTGYLWTRFVDAMELFDEANGSKGQSMEIGNADGYTDDRGRVVFTNAVFTGLCILGDDVPPAMTGATVSTVFSKEDFKSTFEEMLAEFTAEKGANALATKKKQKEEAVVVDDKPVKDDKPSKTEDKPASSASSSSSNSSAESKPASSANKDSEKKADPAKTEQPKAEPAKSDDAKGEETPSSSEPDNDSDADENAEMSAKKDDDKDSSLNKNESASEDDEDKASDMEDTEDDKKKKSFKKDDDKEDSEDSDDEPETDEKDDDNDKKKAQFELNLSEREVAVSMAVRQRYEDGNNVQETYPLEIFDNYGIFRFMNWSTDSEHLYRIEYSVNADDSIKLGDKTEIFSIYVTAQEKNKIESDRAKLSDLEAQIKELTDYKKGIEMSAKKEALNTYRSSLTTEQAEKIEGQFEKLTPEEVEKEIAYAVFESHKEDIKAPRGGIKAMNINKKNDYGYGSANELFHK